MINKLKTNRLSIIYGSTLIAIALICTAVNLTVALPYFLNLIPLDSIYYTLIVAWTQLLFIGIGVGLPLIPLLYGIYLILQGKP